MMSCFTLKCTLFLTVLFITVVGCTNTNKKQPKKEAQLSYQQGQQLFHQYCDECHHEGMIYIMTGPALGSALKKRDKAWFKHHIIKGSYAATEDQDSISIALRAEGWGFMPGYHFLTEDQLEALIYFIQETYKKNKHLERKN